MKKQYVAPKVYAESFELVEHISGPCSTSGQANHIDYSSCGFYNDGDSGQTIFLNANTAKCNYCPFETDEEVEAEFDGTFNECHYTFDNQYAMFSS